MNLYTARHLARSLMSEHGIGDWTFAFDHARRRFGSCQPTRKRITLSRMLTLLNEEPEVRDTILHEIAHALTPGDKHGPAWRAMCVRLGAKPVRCYTDETVTSPPRRVARFAIGCPRCNWSQPRYRRVTRKLVCRRCRTPVVLSIAH
jgi:predicted SprT family Zn-dependent metalloprotease